jgi:hypothetical protein
MFQVANTLLNVVLLPGRIFLAALDFVQTKMNDV